MFIFSCYLLVSGKGNNHGHIADKYTGHFL